MAWTLVNLVVEDRKLESPKEAWEWPYHVSNKISILHKIICWLKRWRVPGITHLKPLWKNMTTTQLMKVPAETFETAAFSQIHLSTLNAQEAHLELVAYANLPILSICSKYIAICNSSEHIEQLYASSNQQGSTLWKQVHFQWNVWKNNIHLSVHH